MLYLISDLCYNDLNKTDKHAPPHFFILLVCSYFYGLCERSSCYFMKFLEFVAKMIYDSLSLGKIFHFVKRMP